MIRRIKFSLVGVYTIERVDKVRICLLASGCGLEKFYFIAERYWAHRCTVKGEYDEIADIERGRD